MNDSVFKMSRKKPFTRGAAGRVVRLLVWILACTWIPVQAAPVIIPAAPQLAASSYLLVDTDSGEVLVAQNTEQRLPPASLTKIMTGYVVAEELRQKTISLDDEVHISVEAWRTQGSRMFVREGTRVRLEDLLRGVIIQSGNDASVALAEHVAGSEAGFADVMNQYAQLLGMDNTHFVNSTGLPDDNHYTTATDLARLTRSLIDRHPEHYRMYLERNFTYNDIRQSNRNLLLWRDPSVDGVKTGHTDASGYCLVASAKRNDMRLVSVVINSPTADSRTRDSLTLLNYGFRYFETYHLYQADQVLRRMRVFGGSQPDVPLGLREELFVTLPRGLRESVEVMLAIPSVLKAPVETGAELGTLTLSVQDEVVKTVPLQALYGVPQAGFLARSRDSALLFFLTTFGMNTSSVD